MRTCRLQNVIEGWSQRGALSTRALWLCILDCVTWAWVNVLLVQREGLSLAWEPCGRRWACTGQTEWGAPWGYLCQSLFLDPFSPGIWGMSYLENSLFFFPSRVYSLKLTLNFKKMRRTVWWCGVRIHYQCGICPPLMPVLKSYVGTSYRESCVHGTDSFQVDNLGWISKLFSPNIYWEIAFERHAWGMGRKMPGCQMRFSGIYF